MASGRACLVEAAFPRLPGRALDCLPKSLGCGLTVSVRRLLLFPLPNHSGHRKEVASLTGVPAPSPESHPFAWFPLAGQRHAIDRRDRNVPVGSPMRCLCGVTHQRGADGDMEWLWPTCARCWDEACRIVGLRPRR
ncbi:MAG: zinc finger protein [Pseudonocardiaceae bacterium]